MDHDQEHKHPVQRLILPSGKAIEVVVFGSVDASPARPAPAPMPAIPAEGLHVCPSCESPLVYPIDWEELGTGTWELELRCPNCDWVGKGSYEAALVEDLDLELERGTEALVRDLRQLTKANMQEELDRLSAALEGDHILPMDF